MATNNKVRILSMSKLNHNDSSIDLGIHFSNKKHIKFEYNTLSDTINSLNEEINNELGLQIINLKDFEYGLKILSRKNRISNICYDNSEIQL